MSLTLPPKTIVRPKGFGKKPNNYYTLHTKPNDIFSIKIEKCEKTTVVGFKNKSDAIFIGKMLETNFIETNEWPDTRSDGTLILPKSKIDFMNFIIMHKWDFEDLKLTCTANILDMVSVDGISEEDTGFKFTGDLYTFEGSLDFYQNVFETKLE